MRFQLSSTVGFNFAFKTRERKSTRFEMFQNYSRIKNLDYGNQFHYKFILLAITGDQINLEVKI